MKTKIYPLSVTRHSAVTAFGTAFLAAFTLFTTAPRASAQTDTVTISAAEFQRMVYSAHLLTQLDEKPELDASLEVLLELDRRNPNINPILLTSLLQETTARFRTNAPSYLQAGGARDEVFAAYLDALRQVPARTNFIPANLSLLNSLVARAQAPLGEPEADMIHSGSQRLLGSQGDLAQRQALLDACTGRAQNRTTFRVAMDGLLFPETFVSLSNTAAEIMSNTNSPLHDNLTMQTLLALSLASMNGSVTVSSNQLMTLFTNETQTFWQTINTNLALQGEINRNHSDLLAYLTNQPAINADAQRFAAVQQDQPRRIASATAAVFVQSKLMAARDPLIKLPGQMQGCVEGLHKITDGITAFGAKDATRLAKVAASGNILAGALDVFNLFSGGESPDEEILREIGNIKTLIGDLSTNMNYRFDRVDQSLTQIYETLNVQFADLGGDVDQIRFTLLNVQSGLFRIERNLATFHALDRRIELVEDMNYVRGFELRAGHPMPYTDNAPSDFLSFENTFFTHAFDRAAWEPLSLYGSLPFGDQYFYSQLSPGGATNVYAEILNYIKKCLRQRLGLTASFPEQPILANPQDWSAGANAWLQLAIENPGHFRRYERDRGYPKRLDDIIGKGRDLTNFFRSLTFAGTNINWPLYDAVQNFYAGKLTSFTDLVRATEQQYATAHGFALDTWRQWSAAAPRLVVSPTVVMQTRYLSLPPVPADATNVIGIASGNRHNLALKADGTVIGWYGQAYDYGQGNGAIAGSNVLAIAAGDYHSLALRANGTVVSWGDNEWGQSATPARATNAVAIAAGGSHSLALKADGTVVAWGNNDYGQISVPAGLNNVVAIDGGGNHTLALRADGTVVGWGSNLFDEANGGRAGSNVVAVAAGYSHSLALRADGSVIAWGANNFGQVNVPVGLSNVVAIAAGHYHSLALKADGTVVAWGGNDSGQTDLPDGATNVIAISAGSSHSLFLTATQANGADNSGPFLIRAQIPERVSDLLYGVNSLVLTNLDLDLYNAAIELSGSKALLQAVLELAMPYTLERDDALHGFLCGSESLVDLEVSRTFLEAEIGKLRSRPDAKPQVLTELAWLRYLRFADRLNARLNDLQATGQPEIPRIVGHTLRLLNLIRDSWASAPPPALEIGREANGFGMLLYGEPYAHYTLQYLDNLSVPGWTTTSITNLHNEQLIAPPASGPSRFYRGLLPVP